MKMSSIWSWDLGRPLTEVTLLDSCTRSLTLQVPPRRYGITVQTYDIDGEGKRDNLMPGAPSESLIDPVETRYPSDSHIMAEATPVPPTAARSSTLSQDHDLTSKS